MYVYVRRGATWNERSLHTEADWSGEIGINNTTSVDDLQPEAERTTTAQTTTVKQIQIVNEIG